MNGVYMCVCVETQVWSGTTETGSAEGGGGGVC